MAPRQRTASATPPLRLTAGGGGRRFRDTRAAAAAEADAAAAAGAALRGNAGLALRGNAGRRASSAPARSVPRRAAAGSGSNSRSVALVRSLSALGLPGSIGDGSGTVEQPAVEESQAVEQSTFLTTASLEELRHLAASQSTRCPEEMLGDSSASASASTTLAVEDGSAMALKGFRRGSMKASKSGSRGFRETTSTVRSFESSSRGMRSKSLSALSVPTPSRASRGSSLSGARDRLLNKALFVHNEANYYDGFPVQPATGWFQSLFAHLVDKEQLDSKAMQSLLASCDLSLAETLIISNEAKLLLCSIGKGLVATYSEATAADFLQHAQAWSSVAQERHPVVVEKRKQGVQSNLCRAMDLRELQGSFLRGQKDEECLIFQRFIPPRSNTAPSVLRIAWRDSMAPRGFRLKLCAPSEELRGEAGQVGLRTTNWLASSEIPSTQAIELKTVPPRAAQVAEQVLHFTQTVFHIQLKQIVVDLIQDEDGKYCLIQVKSFTVQNQWLSRFRSSARGESRSDDWQFNLRGCSCTRGSLVIPEAKSPRQSSVKRPSTVRTATCAMCSCSQPVKKLTKRMTPKMMLETEHHLRKRGLQLFHIGRVRAMKLSQACPVCEACWSLYLAEIELCAVETRLARSVGIHLHGQDGDESYVPFSGVLAAVRAEQQQIDFSGCHRHRDTFRIYDPLPSPAPSVMKDAGSRSEVSIDDSGSAAVPRRGGEAIAYADRSAPVLEPVPPVVLQWRMLIHINRLVDVMPELQALSTKCAALKNGAGELRLRLEVPWAMQPHDFPLPKFNGSNCDISATTVHFIFTDASTKHPLQSFFEQSTLRLSLLHVDGEHPQSEGTESSGGRAEAGSGATEQKAADAAPRTRQLLSSQLTMEKIGYSPDGFLAQTWVIFCSAWTKMCQLKLTIGLVCDHTVSSEYVALHRYLDAWVPVRPYFSSDVLPTTWIASIKGDRGPHGLSTVPGVAEADASSERVPAATSSTNIPTSKVQSGSMQVGAAICCDRATPLDGPLLLAPRPSRATLNEQEEGAPAGATTEPG